MGTSAGVHMTKWHCPRGCGQKLVVGHKYGVYDEDGARIPGLVELDIECLHCDYMTRREKSMGKMIIMRGIPGSGKSTKVKEILKEMPDAKVFSTDNYWLRPDGTYDFNPKLIGQAHQWNQREAKVACRTDCPVIVIDNTNTQEWEMEPYTAMAKRFDYEVEIKAVHGKDLTPTEVQEYAERNTHGVPLKTVKAMYDRWEVV